MATRRAVRFAPTAGKKLKDLRGVAGWYLLCFDEPLVLGINVRREVRHYLGSSVNMARRLQKHAANPDARILQIAKSRGITFRVVRIWEAPEGTNGAARWAEERRLKGISAGRLCPCCHPGTKAGCRRRLPAPVIEEQGEDQEDMPW